MKYQWSHSLERGYYLFHITLWKEREEAQEEHLLCSWIQLFEQLNESFVQTKRFFFSWMKWMRSLPQVICSFLSSTELRSKCADLVLILILSLSYLSQFYFLKFSILKKTTNCYHLDTHLISLFEPEVQTDDMQGVCFDLHQTWSQLLGLISSIIVMKRYINTIEMHVDIVAGAIHLYSTSIKTQQ